MNFRRGTKPRHLRRLIWGNWYNKFITLALIVLLASIVGVLYNPKQVKAVGWYDVNWTYRTLITLDHTKVSTNDQSSFPILINHTDNNWKDVNHAGHVSLTNGNDIIFTDSDGVTLLNYEVEKYDGSTGQLIVWIRIGTLSHTVDNTLYIYYGNPSASANTTANAQATWDANYKGVWHLKEDPTSTAPQMKDSTNRANDATIQGIASSSAQVPGKFDGSLTSDTGNNCPVIQNTAGDFNFDRTNPFSVDVWVKTTLTTTTTFIGKWKASSPFTGWYLDINCQDNTISCTSVSGAINFSLNNTFLSNSLHEYTAATSVNDGNWHLVSATYDGTSTPAGVKIYLDGNSQSLTNGSNSLTSSITNTNWTFIQGWNANAGAGFTGCNAISMDENRISSSVRSADWIATEYNNENSPDVGGFIKSLGTESQLTLTGYDYRLFNNANSTDVGTALAAVNTPARLAYGTAAFRVRQLIHVTNGDLATTANLSLKLQYIDAGTGTCTSPNGTNPSSWTDVTAATKIAYNDNATPTDGSNLTANANDPTHSPDTVQPETYEELNNFTNSRNAINDGQDGMWDFSLKDNGGTDGDTYCLRAINATTGSVLNSYSFYPQIIMNNAIPAAPTLSSPINSVTGISTTPLFRFSTTDGAVDYLNFWIDVCSTSNCSSIVRSICQINTGSSVPGTCSSPSQTGWDSQDQQSATAYAPGTMAAYYYQAPALSTNTQYWWRAYAIDPGGSNTWSSASSIGTFTTVNPNQSHDQVYQGNVCFGAC